MTFLGRAKQSMGHGATGTVAKERLCPSRRVTGEGGSSLCAQEGRGSTGGAVPRQWRRRTEVCGCKPAWAQEGTAEVALMQRLRLKMRQR